jgi:haloacetate dehalogenase
MPYLTDRFDVIRPDLRGLGDSARDGDVESYCKHELARDVIAVLDTMGVDSFMLAGHDWGGAVAQEIAIAVPDRVSRLAIMNIHLLNNAAGYRAAEQVHAAKLHRAYWYQTFMQTPGLSEAMVPGNERAWLGTFLRGKDRHWQFPAEAIDEYVRCYSIADTPTTGANYYRAMSLDAKRWSTLRDYVQPMPTLLLWGMHDPIVVPEFLTHFESCFASARVVEVDASHFLIEERSGVVGPELRQHFLSQAR